MTIPKLDGRSVKDLLREIQKKSEFYTPEWRYDPEDMDAGGALARIFAEMFYETIDRYNRFPDKCYLEFLNMQGVCAKPGSPSVGMAVAEALEAWEPRIMDVQVEIPSKDGSREMVEVHISYVVRTTNNQFNMVYPFYMMEGEGR